MIGVKATLHLSQDGQTVTRRFMAGEDVTSGYMALTAKLTQLFPELSEGNFTIHLLDPEGDLVVSTSDEEVFIALSSLPEGATLNIVIEEKPTSTPSHAVCMGCGTPIRGHQYTCVVCAGYDLCSPCEQAGKHAHHPVVRVTTNHQPFQTFNGRRTRLSDIGSHGVSRLFPQNGRQHGRSSRQGPFDSPCTSGLFSCHNPSAFTDFHQMANNLIQNWCRSMPPPRSKDFTTGKKTSSKGSPTTDAAKGTVPSGQYEKSDEFDQALFEQMVEEMTESFNEKMKDIGEKQKNNDDNVGQKDNQQSEGDNRGCDLEQMTDMLGPLVGDFVRAMGGNFDEEKNEQENFSNTNEDFTGGKTPKSESSKLRRPMKVVSQTESSTWSSHADKQGEYTQQVKQTKLPHEDCKKEKTSTFSETTETRTNPDEGCPKGTPQDGGCKAQRASVPEECKENTQPGFEDCNESKVSNGGGEKTKAADRECEKHTGECRNRASPCLECTKQTPPQLGDCVNQAARLEEYKLTYPKHAPCPAADPWSNPTPGTSRDADCCVPGLCTDPPGKQSAPKNSDVTKALLQLRSMGFTEEVGRLIGLLRAENGDVQRVIEKILPAPT